MVIARVGEDGSFSPRPSGWQAGKAATTMPKHGLTSLAVGRSHRTFKCMWIPSRFHATLFGVGLALSSGWTASASGQEPVRRTVRAAAPATPGTEEIPQELRLTPEQEQTAALLLSPTRRKEASAIADLLREGRPFEEVRPQW